jgi:hypothetical protein
VTVVGALVCTGFGSEKLSGNTGLNRSEQDCAEVQRRRMLRGDRKLHFPGPLILRSWLETGE